MHIDPNWIVAVTSVLAVLLVPALVLLIRGAVRWSKSEADIAEIKKNLHAMVEQGDIERKEIRDRIEEVAKDERTVHNEIIAQLRDDRAATDKRLRFIEEYWMKKGQGSP